MKCGRGFVGRVEEAVEDLVHFHEAAGPAVDKEQRNGVSAIGPVVDEVKGNGICKVRVWVQRDCGCKLLEAMDTISINRLKEPNLCG